MVSLCLLLLGGTEMKRLPLYQSLQTCKAAAEVATAFQNQMVFALVLAATDSQQCSTKL